MAIQKTFRTLLASQTLAATTNVSGSWIDVSNLYDMVFSGKIVNGASPMSALPLCILKGRHEDGGEEYEILRGTGVLFADTTGRNFVREISRGWTELQVTFQNPAAGGLDEVVAHLGGVLSY